MQLSKNSHFFFHWVCPIEFFSQSQLSLRHIKCPYSLLCRFCTPKRCLKFWTPFEQCMWFLKIMWKKAILKTKFFLLILECRQKTVQRKIFWLKNSKKLRISWKILCQIETLTKQFPQAWDTNMPYRIFFPILFESLTHQMSVSLLCGFCTPKGCLKFWTPFEQCMWFLKIMWKKTILKT